MALVRCTEHGQPSGRTREYVRSVSPFGYPDTAAICGSVPCIKPGRIWLEAKESAAYDEGERIFRVPNNAIKVRAE